MVKSDLIDPNLSEEEAFRRIIVLQTKRYPLMEVQDLYKLIHQASMGSEHAVHDLEVTRTFLEREVIELVEAPDEPVQDIISPDGRIARINLRPYLASNASLDKLFDAFVRTANDFDGNTKRLKRYWSYAEQLTRGSTFTFSSTALQTFFTQMDDQGFPAVHHSAAYSAAYQPAYRVIVYAFLDI